MHKERYICKDAFTAMHKWENNKNMKDSIHVVLLHVFVCPVTDWDIFCFFRVMFSVFVQEKIRFFSQKNTKNSVYFFPHKVPLFKKNK